MRVSCFLGLTIAITFYATGHFAMGQAASSDRDAFEARTQQGADGSKLLYRLLKPADASTPGVKHPLLIFLHGAGERGDDNQAQLTWGKQFMLDAARQYGCFVVVPQCPNGKKWVEVDWGKPTHLMPEGASESMKLVLEAVAGLQKEFSIDADRLYVMGLSMGGYGTWDTIERYPDMFAAAVPICGGGDETAAGRIKTPVWAFHGDKDPAVPVVRTRNMIAAIKAAGGEPKYTEYPGRGHDSWIPAMGDPELSKWLFAQKRKTQ